ncbi:hypothetical protein QKT49_gp178 [Acanthamoeba castellanii medusavirus]|uniref:Uncharacterized protein n=1 Tax=Acanthamoeba castellanii medusavirus J1 TaxID=3114988 RepID=A0A3T1CXU2_9VIRU|nr:hypothetical protein QKT49_gp178 [Acanthamoeba castellanii medusavirus]BBI30585.1 hypothetical protein [Acanthamoeba castellanii medusavirus J1]
MALSYRIADGGLRVTGLRTDPPRNDNACVRVDPDGRVARFNDASRSVVTRAFNGANVPLFSVWTQPPLNMKGGDGQRNGAYLNGWSTSVATDNQYPREARRTVFFIDETNSGLDPLAGVWTVPRHGNYHISCYVSTSTRKPGGSPGGLSFIPGDIGLAAWLGTSNLVWWVGAVAELTFAVALELSNTFLAFIVGTAGIAMTATVVAAALGIALVVVGIALLAADAVVLVDWILSFIDAQPPDDPGRLGIFLAVNNLVTVGAFRENAMAGVNDPEGIYDSKHFVTDMRLNAGDQIKFWLGFTGTDGIDGLSARWAVTQTYDYGTDGTVPISYTFRIRNPVPLAFRQKPLPEGLSGATPRLGTATAMTGDGAFAAVSAPTNGTGGTMWIYRQRQGAWFQYQIINNPVDAMVSFGASLAIAQGDRTLVVGAPGANTVYIYPRDNDITGTWSLPHLTLTQPGVRFGASVAISEDGTTIVVGDPDYAGGQGAIWICHRDPDTEEWAPSVGPLAHPGAAPSDGCAFGTNVCVSSNGRVVASNGPGLGRLHTWTYNGTTWNTTEAAIVPRSGSATPGFARAISMDPAGHSLFVTDQRSGSRGAYLFTRSSVFSIWGNERRFFPTSAFVFDPEDPESVLPTTQFGASIVAAADGKGCVVGDPGAGGYFATTLRAEDNATWAAWPAVVAPLQTDPPSNIGVNHSLSAARDLSKLFMGGPTDSSNRGSIWMA